MPRYSAQKKKVLDTLMRDEVYRVAVEIITTEGLRALTMDRVAGGVGVSRGTLYNYFTDRDAVVDYLEERTFGPILVALQEIAAGDLDPRAKLERMACWIFSALEDDFSLVIALKPNKNSQANRESQQCRHASAVASVESVVREGIEAGDFKDLPPSVVANLFFDLLAGRIEAMAAIGKFEFAEETVSTLTEIFFGGLQRPS